MAHEHSFATPGPVGLGALAMACFTFWAVFTGKVTHDALPILACWLFGGFICQFVAGVIELKDHGVTGGNVFVFFSAFFMATAALSSATKYGLLHAGLPFDGRIEGYGWMAGAAFLTMLTPNYLKSTKLLFWAVVLIDIALWCIVALDMRLNINRALFAQIVGWTLFFAGWAGIYLAGATAMAVQFGKPILPIPSPHVK